MQYSGKVYIFDALMSKSSAVFDRTINSIGNQSTRHTWEKKKYY